MYWGVWDAVIFVAIRIRIVKFRNCLRKTNDKTSHLRFCVQPMLRGWSLHTTICFVVTAEHPTNRVLLLSFLFASIWILHSDILFAVETFADAHGRQIPWDIGPSSETLVYVCLVNNQSDWANRFICTYALSTTNRTEPIDWFICRGQRKLHLSGLQRTGTNLLHALLNAHSLYNNGLWFKPGISQRHIRGTPPWKHFHVHEKSYSYPKGSNLFVSVNPTF